MQIAKWKSEQELKYPDSPGFFENSLGVRILIGLFFALVLFLFLHYREEHLEIYEIDTIAPKFVVAQTDFTFKDDEKRAMLQQDAVRDVGKIWRISDREVRAKRQELDRQLSQVESWQKLLPGVTLEEMHQASDKFQRGVLQLKMIDVPTWRLLQRLNLEIDHYQVFSPVEQQAETYIPQHVWGGIEEQVLGEGFVADEVGIYLTHFYETVPWRLEEDIEAEKALRLKVQRLVGEQFTPVQAGDRIIDQGDRVTHRNLVMLQSMKRAMSEGKNLTHPLIFLGSLILAVLTTFVSASYLYYNHNKIFFSNRKLFLLVAIASLILAMSRGLELWVMSSKPSFAELVRYPLFVPLAAILVCHLINTGVATFVAGFLTIILVLGGTLDATGMVMNLAASLVAIMETRNLRRRKEIFIVCAKAWIATVWVIIAFHLYDRTIFDISMVNDLVSSALFLLFTAILVIGFLPLFETSFQIMTDVTLMEYMDPSHELLRRLSIEAPGTYQHSVVVGSLAESAAVSIGANGLFCRVATLYHDIGKLATPQYFTENQQGPLNLHQLLTPKESAQVIIAHVPEGVALARMFGLPEQFVDIIKEHHGTSLVYFFYRKYLDEMGGDKSKVDQKVFRYSGPTPRTKESAIIMIADTFEAASRSLDEVNEQTLAELIEKLIQIKIQDGQFDECILSFQELAQIKKVMVHTLIAAGHSRIKYPKAEEGDQFLPNAQDI